MADLYQTLGLTKTATEEDIRKAYRKLAKEHHPDLNPGDKEAERRFKDISAANAILSDPEKRRDYDAGKIDETGAARPERKFYREYADAGPGFKYQRGEDFQGFDDLGGIFGDLFGQRGGRAREGADAQFRMRGGDVRYTLPVDFIDAVNGAKKRVDMPDGRTLDITIPAGVKDGQVLRLRGQGSQGIGDAPAGDAYIEVELRPHPVFRREGSDIKSVLPITMAEALGGATVQADTVTGPVDLKIPKGSNTGRILRLRGKGVQGRTKGDHLVELQVMMPDRPDDELERLVAEWESRHPYNPRQTGARK